MAEEGEMTEEQFTFLMAIEEFKRTSGRSYPSWRDVFRIAQELGYRQTSPPGKSINRIE
jgi:hypothetical protein